MPDRDPATNADAISLLFEFVRGQVGITDGEAANKAGRAEETTGRT